MMSQLEIIHPNKNQRERERASLICFNTVNRAIFEVQYVNFTNRKNKTHGKIRRTKIIRLKGHAHWLHLPQTKMALLKVFSIEKSHPLAPDPLFNQELSQAITLANKKVEKIVLEEMVVLKDIFTL